MYIIYYSNQAFLYLVWLFIYFVAILYNSYIINKHLFLIGTKKKASTRKPPAKKVKARSPFDSNSE